MGTLVLLLAGVGFVVALVAQAQAKRVDGDLVVLRKRLGAVEQELLRLRAGVVPVRETTPEAEAEPEPQPEAVHPSRVEVLPPEPDHVPPPRQPEAEAPARPAMEQALAERWLVWLGGVALALGGAFLVKMSVDMGVLGPAARVALGAVGGLGLMALGHVLRRRPVMARHVPPALVGAGAAMTFASVFAAHALYGMVGTVPTFVTLAAVALLTAVLALSHGPFVALLGLAGAYAVPLLVNSSEPQALALFTYLLAVSAAMLVLLRWREWWWLAWVVLAASAGWSLVWMLLSWNGGDEIVLGGYLLALAALFAAFRLGVPWVPALALPAEARQVGWVVIVAFLVVAALLVLVAEAAGMSLTVRVLPFLFAIGVVAFGWRDAVFDRLPWLAAAVLAVVVWRGGAVDDGAVAGAVTLGILLFAFAGFALMDGAQRPWVWAATAALSPVLLLVAAYARRPEAWPEWGWCAAALLLGGALAAAAERIARNREHPGLEAALAAVAVGVVAALALAVTTVLREAWLSVALALMLPGIAWVEWHLSVAGLRRVALLVAGAVLVRLAFNPQVLDYALTEGSVVNWLLYGYGVPAVAFWLAARRFARSGADLTVTVLDGGAMLFAVLLTSLEIHHVMVGGLDVVALPSLAEAALHAATWLAGGVLAFVVWHKSENKVALWGGRLLLALGSVTAVLFQAGLDNPLWTGAAVGEATVLNVLVLAYGVPAVLFALHWWVAPPVPDWGGRLCAALSIAFAFLWLSLEVRHAFAGPHLNQGAVGQAELWAYSVAWLAGGVALLAGGLWRGEAMLRRAGLAVVLVVVVKVFVLDLAHLAGLWRALSFLGLGAVLVTLGGAYRRFVKVV